MIISDLNYFEAVSGEELTGGRTRRYSLKKRVDINERVNSDVRLRGNLSTVDGVATATGNNSFTEIIGGSSTTPRSSRGDLILVSASD